MNKTLQEYANLVNKIKALEESRDLLKQSIIDDFTKNKIEKLETSFGNFSIGCRKTYTFTESIKKMEDKLKIAKNKEIEKEIARATESKYVIFREIEVK